MLSGSKEAWNPNTAGLHEEWWIHLEADILPASGTGKVMP